MFLAMVLPSLWDDRFNTIGMNAPRKSSPSEEVEARRVKIPLKERLAYTQARSVLLVAVMIGLIMSGVQISLDLYSQKESLKIELEQLVRSLKAPAETAVWHVEKELAVSVVNGALGHQAVIFAKIVSDEEVLQEKRKEVVEAQQSMTALKYLFGDPYQQEFALFSPDDRSDQSGVLYLEVDPVLHGQAFLKRVFWVLMSGFVRSFLLSVVLLFLFYYSFTRPVLALSRYLQEYDPKQSKRPQRDASLRNLKGELGALLNDTDSLMDSVANFNDTLEQRVEARTKALNLSNQTIESTAVCLLTVDPEFSVLYANSAANSMLSRLNSHGLSGENVAARRLDQLFPFDEAELKSLNDGVAIRKNVTLGEAVFALAVNPIMGPTGRMGAAIEFRECTQEHRAQASLEAVVQAASEGDLQHRLDTHLGEAYQQVLSERVNALLEINEQVISELDLVFKALSSGDLSAQVGSQCKGMFLALKNNVNATVGKFKVVIDGIESLSTLVNAHSGDIRSLSADLTDHNQQLNRSLGSALSELSSMTDCIAKSHDRVRQTGQLAENAQAQADEGRNVTRDAVQAMGQLSAASDQISGFTEVINGIAFQTTMLSLNAAVEAARAGESGRGFAVVATEVQSLAKRVTDAAREIDELLQQSKSIFGQCDQLIHRSGECWGQVQSASVKVRDCVVQVAQFSDVQSRGIDHVNHTFRDLDEKTVKITLAIESIDVRSQEMVDKACQLENEMSFFQVSSRHC